jgi:type IV pilus assembly protein PilB
MEAAAATNFPAPLPFTLHAEQQRLPLGTLLVRDALITTEQLELALAEKEQTSHRLGEIVVAHGWVEASALARLLAEQHHVEYLDLASTEIDSSAATLLPEKLARRYEALPVRFLSQNVVLVAVSDPTNVVASDDLKLALGMNLRIGVSTASDLVAAIDRIHRPHGDEEAAASSHGAGDIRTGTATTAPAVTLVNALIAKAIDAGASDLHFEPESDRVTVRIRVDGVMRHLDDVPKEMQPAVSSRLKIMAELDIAERRAPQDGRMSIQIGGMPMDLRCAVLPTTYGEQLVLRIMNRAGGRLGLAELGMSSEAEEAFGRAIRQPYGAVLTVGPTGSGKTTTLYAALDVLNDHERCVMTIEDPVEYQTPGLNQVEVNFKSGLTFARGLRTILRSDPDVLLVGEIRDEETARIAVQAAMTGHLVLTTLHSHNAASSIARLTDMGVEPSLLATSINCIVAQRLARRLCVHCREPYWPAEPELVEIGLAEPSADTWLYKATGCTKCSGTGYAGRVALYEVMTVHGRLRRLIESGSTEEIFAEAVAQGMQTLRQDGMRLALAGVSSLDEIRRVTGDRLI